MQDLGYVCSAPQGVTIPEDAVRRELNHINNERAWSAARVAMRAQGFDTPSEPDSLGGDDEEENEDEE
jgi:hypothetical protein